MGRYYDGDIEGKFWFGVQSSIAADRFGVSYTEPNYVDYYFNEEDLPGVEEELENIREILGEEFQKFDQFFNDHPSYNQDMLIEAGFDPETVRANLSHYADYFLGIKIRDCIKENGSCSFTAEL